MNPIKRTVQNLLTPILLAKLGEPKLRLFYPTGENYLTRWELRAGRKLSIYLHKMDHPDPDRHAHNHPWPAVSLVLWGWYEQVRLPYELAAKTYSQFSYSTRHLGLYHWSELALRERCRWFNRLGKDYHRIEKLSEGGAWTLVLIAGSVSGRDRQNDSVADARRGSWGFLVDGRHVDWRYQKGLLAAVGTVSGVKLGSDGA